MPDLPAGLRMSDADFRRQLIAMRDELQQLAGEENDMGATVELDQARVGRLSRMDALQAQSMSLEVTRRRERELLAVGSALRRLERGEFGDCLECGEAISEARLKLNPAVTLCIGCANKAE
jgi:DnaK suppressor protein